ncbi:MAG: hypothetical protein ACRC6V_05145 [Bacteroidales bacterium]
MPIMKVRGIGGKGVVKDLPPFDLPPDTWNDAKNVRFVANRVEKMGGYLPVLMDGMPDDPPLAITSRNNTQDQVYGTKDSLYMIQGRQHLLVSKGKSNPLYKPPKIPYDKYDSTKPEDDREKIVDPNDPDKEIVNPEYNPKEVDNPDYDKTIPETIPGFKYSANPENTWYYTTLSNAIIINNKLDDPQGLVPYKDAFSDLPGWGWPNKDKRPKGTEGEKSPRDWKAGRVRSFRNYLVALDMIEGGIDLPQRVRWSNVAYVNELPPDWIEDDEARDGGFNDLTDANGRIVDGIPLRDTFMVYTDQETYEMQYVGGILIFNFKKLFSDSGILAPECAVEFEQKHFVISKDDIFVHNGSSKQPVASGRVKQYLIDEISSVNPLATKVFAYTPRKEIWISYVGPGQTSHMIPNPDYKPADPVSPENPKEIPSDPEIQWQCNRCAVWNWEWDTWTFYEIPLSYDMGMAAPPDLTTMEWEDFDGDVGPDAPLPEDQVPPPEDWWDSPKWEFEQWSDLGKDFIKRIPYIASPDKCLYTIDIGEEQILWNARDKEEKRRPVIAELVRTHLDMDEAVEDIRSHKFLKHISPQIRGAGNIHVFIGGSETASKEPDWDNWQIFNIEEDTKVDCYSNNRYPAIKFVDMGKGDWSIQGYDINFVVEGNR